MPMDHGMSTRASILVLLAITVLTACSSDAGDRPDDAAPDSIPQFTTDPPVEILEEPSPPTGLIVVDTRDGAIELTLNKCRQTIDQLGERIFS